MECLIIIAVSPYLSSICANVSCFATITHLCLNGCRNCDRLTVSTRLPSDVFDPPTWEVVRYLVLDSHALAMWVPPLALAVLLRVITARWKHQLLFPLCESPLPVVWDTPE